MQSTTMHLGCSSKGQRFFRSTPGVRKAVIKYRVNFVDPKKDQASQQQGQDGLKIIYDDHNHFRKLFSRYEKSSDKQEKLSTVREIVKNLSAHSSAEQRYVYPLIKSKLDRGDLEERNYLDERLNQLLLDWIDNHTPISEPEWEVYDDTFHKLKRQIQDHMTEEERLVLKALGQVLSDNEKQQLYDDLAWAKEHGPTHPHPESPQHPFASTIMHRVVGAVDRVVDKATGATENKRPDRDE